MEEKDLKQIKEIVDQSVQQGFEREFPKAFEREFPKAFEREFPKAFEKEFSKAFKHEFPKAFAEEFGQIWEHNLAPAFDDVYKRLDKADVRMDGFEGRLDGIDGKTDVIDGRLNRIESQMVTKSYLDDKLADLEGGMIVKLRKEDEKVNGVIDSLKKHKIVPIEELKELDNLQVFPRVQI